ncbi:hypothetical protein DBR37_12920 [Herminiimonas sp. KBW02]|uniref:hypothetical protein n=1 Tax=Herminiimonas sp. KBW02 TaxID=2153363 RepID=UPI000F59E814|nr:hypothetical protein [Herminiimonas sp. KBW02]RQO34014.1 hypothetical protein DBR37_12920 [Herminiimonas sp. KBW02]
MKILSTFAICLFTWSTAIAAPGSHGPNGEHLDAPGGTARLVGGTGPRIDTFTEAFELVGYVKEDELSILIDRYETNEPVLNGKLEVEYAGQTATATFHADHGDYAIDTPELLAALRIPGKHALLFTFSVGEETDLLEATLEVVGDSHADEHSHEHKSFITGWLLAGLLIATLLLLAVVALIRRRSHKEK